MGWEQRGNNLYYYRKKRIGQHVSSEYMGTGAVGKLLNELDQEEREELTQTRAQWKTQKQVVKKMESDLAGLHQTTTCLMKATLLVSGYHPHKGQWRKRRNA